MMAKITLKMKWPKFFQKPNLTKKSIKSVFEMPKNCVRSIMAYI